MQEKTKKYIEDMLLELEMQLGTLEVELSDAIKIRNKLQRFYKKIIRNC
jgi:hypothetical protein